MASASDDLKEVEGWYTAVLPIYGFALASLRSAPATNDSNWVWNANYERVLPAYERGEREAAQRMEMLAQGVVELKLGKKDVVAKIEDLEALKEALKRVSRRLLVADLGGGRGGAKDQVEEVGKGWVFEWMVVPQSPERFEGAWAALSCADGRLS